MKRPLLYFIFLMLATFACQQPDTKKISNGNPSLVKDSSHQTEFTFDSSALEKIIKDRHYPDSIVDRVKRFYQNRNYQYAWFDTDEFAEQAYNFWNAQSSYINYTKDSSLFNPSLQELMDTVSNGGNLIYSQKLNTEVALTVQFFRYARRAYQGNIRLGEHDLDWYIPRKRIDMTALLDSLISNKGKNLEAYEPVNRQYHLLKEKLLTYYQLSESDDWKPVSLQEQRLKIGDTSLEVVAIKKKLHSIGDLPSIDTSNIYDNELAEGLKSFQRRFGLKEDGKPGAKTVRYLNETLEVRIKQILVNMERMRWIPVEPGGDFILVNIPQYLLIAFENGSRKFAMNIVVGTTQNETVVFTGNMKYVVFSPYWNIPPSIIKKEIIPAMKRDRNYLARHNMEWNKGAVRQKPGPNNSLGKVKFLFPNNHNIYLHDSPAESLFNEEKRAFSHGCIRLANPKKLAIWVLRKQPDWTEKKIEKAMNAGKEKFVTLASAIPVFLGYFTAWVDEKGNLNFRDDIYGHDKKLADRIFAK